MRFLLLSALLASGLAYSADYKTAPTKKPAYAIFKIKGKEYHTGLVRPDNWKRGVVFFSPVLNTAALPDKFNWEEQGVKTPVRDQGSCGSCWAFGTTQTLENAVKRAEGKDLDFAEQELVSCAKEFYGCGGGWFAGDYILKNGLADEPQFPYTASNAKCKSGLKPAANILKWGYVGEENREPTKDEVKAALMQYGALSVTVSASGSWDVDSQGVLKGCGNGQVNHMVAIVGWDDSINGGSWRMKNSWGADWGQNGYAWVKYGCYKIASEAAWVVYKNDGPSPTPPPGPNPPSVDLPTDLLVRYGKTLVLAVKAEAGVTYTWFKDGVKVGEGALLVFTTDKSALYKVTAENSQGKSEALTQITVQL